MKALATLISLVAFAAGAARADEEAIALDKLPEPVKKLLSTRFAKAEKIKASKETENGKTTYEVEVKSKGEELELTIDPEGKLLAIEKDIDVDELPKAVTDAIAAKYPGAKIKSAEITIDTTGDKEKVAYFDAEIETADKKTLEVEATLEGKILKAEAKTEKKKK